ncbi:sigma factor [Faecalibacterium sp. AF28-13AC]|uniref:sigma factor n=1 Tax=Faecalibacterium sp. AF28-13AC TaxID=2292234 RepID=UPI00325AB2EA
MVHVAKKYYAQPSDQEDLISIGTIGLMKAVDTFDSTRKARFSTYASRCIENAILTRTNAGGRIGTISTTFGGVLVLFRVYREGGPVDLILR